MSELIRPIKYRDFVRTDEKEGWGTLKELSERLSEFMQTGNHKTPTHPLNPVSVETHYVGEGEFFLRFWYREGWER